MKRRIRKKVRSILFILIFLTITFVLSACGKNESGQGEPELLLGFSQIGSESA